MVVNVYSICLEEFYDSGTCTATQIYTHNFQTCSSSSSKQQQIEIDLVEASKYMSDITQWGSALDQLGCLSQPVPKNTALLTANKNYRLNDSELAFFDIDKCQYEWLELLSQFYVYADEMSRQFVLC